jgi:hypothetical protein
MELLVAAARTQCPEVAFREALLPGDSLAARAAWVGSSVADVRKAPAHQAEQTTQVLQGESLQVLLQEQDWLLVRCVDGYLGWLRDWHAHLVPQGTVQEFTARTNGRVLWPQVSLREHPDGPRCGEAILGTAVVRSQVHDGWCEVELPGRRHGWVPLHSLREGTALWPLAVSSLLDMLRSFRGVPYVWGGKSPKGFDCSGLVQFVFGMHGVPLPRDSDQQYWSGEPVEVPSPGDLLFFGAQRITHVGVSLGGEAFIHARGEVRCNGLVPGSPLYAPDLAAIFRGARRVLPQPR